jgi:hypothetical protein
MGLGGTGRGPTWQLASVGVIVAEAVKRRRARQAVSRPKVVQFSLTEEEFEEVSGAASRSGLARGAFAAEVTLAAAWGAQAPAPSPLREALVEVMTAAGLVRRVGTNLNQAVAKLNATGQRSDDLLPAAEFCVRVIRRLGTRLVTPKKKPKGGELLDWQKEFNAQVSSCRAAIERLVAHFKGWRIFHTDYRRPYRTYRDAFDATRGLFFFSITWGFE